MFVLPLLATAAHKSNWISIQLSLLISMCMEIHFCIFLTCEAENSGFFWISWICHSVDSIMNLTTWPTKPAQAAGSSTLESSLNLNLAAAQSLELLPDVGLADLEIFGLLEDLADLTLYIFGT